MVCWYIIFVDEKRLDVLVNNAGVMDIGKKRQVTKDGFELHLGVNYLGKCTVIYRKV